MTPLLNIWNGLVNAWTWFDGQKTNIGLVIGGIVAYTLGVEAFFTWNPPFLEPILGFLQKVSMFLTTTGLGHKVVKAGSDLVQKAKDAAVAKAAGALVPKP